MYVIIIIMLLAEMAEWLNVRLNSLNCREFA